MNLLKAMVIGSIGMGFGQLALAGAADFEDVKMPCAVLKNGKVLKQQTCVADGFEHGNVYGGGYGWRFNVQGYGNIKLDDGVKFKTNAKGEPMTNKHNEVIEDKSWTTLNGKPANIRLRLPKSFALLNPAQEKQYYEGKISSTPYTCWYYKSKVQARFDEVCYIESR